MRGIFRARSGDPVIDGPRPFTEDELVAVQALRERGFDPERIARVLKRSRSTVYKQLDRIAHLETKLAELRPGARR